MAMLNIGGENAGDAFYRYKMPKLQCRVSMPAGHRTRRCVIPAVALYAQLSCSGPHALFESLQIEGRGNGIKTNVVNNVDIAKALERPPECERHPPPNPAL